MNTRRLLIEAYLYVLAFALLCMGTVGLFGFLLVAEPTRHSVVLLPDSALLLLITGSLLLAVCRRSWRSLLFSAALLIAFVGYTLSHNYLAGGADEGVSLVSGFLRVRSSFALVVLAVSAAFILGLGKRPARWLAQLIGAAVMLLALASQLSFQQPGEELLSLGFKYSSSQVINLLVLLLGLAAIVHVHLPIKLGGNLDRVSLRAGLSGVLLTSIGWYVLSMQATEAISRESELLLAKAQGSTAQNLDAYMALIQRLGERWQVLGRLPSGSFWQQEAGSYLRDFPSLELVAVIDAQRESRFFHARDEEKREWLDTFLASSENQSWLKHVFEDGHVHLSRSYRHAASAKPKALIAMPLSLPGMPAQLVVASMDVRSVIDSVLGSQLTGFVVRAYERDQLLYDSSLSPDIKFNTRVGERLVAIDESDGWRIVSYLNRSGVLSNSDYLVTLVALFGLILSYLLMLSQRLVWLAHDRSHKLESANNQLQLSIDDLARAQRLNRRIMQFTLDMLCSIDAEGRFTQVSSSCEKLLGYKPEELIGRRYIELVVPEDQALTEAEAAVIMAGRSTHQFRNRYRHRDGHVLHILWSADWSEDEQAMFAVAHDITALVQGEVYTQTQRDILGLIATEQPLHDILEAICLMVEVQQPKALCSVLLFDAEGKYLFTGAAPSLPEAYSQAIDGVAIGPNVGSCGTAAYLKALVVVEDIQLDPLWDNYRELALPHGLRACWSFPLLSQQGQVLGTFAIYQHEPGQPSPEQQSLFADAAQLAALAIVRAQDRQHLQESEQRFRSLFTFNPDPVYSFDLQGRFVSMNGAGVQLTGISEVGIIGRHFAELIVAEDRERTGQHFANACTGIPQRYETQILTPVGQRLSLDVSNLPIMVDGKVTGVFGIAKDVTEREHMTASLHESLQRAELKAEQLRGLSEAAVASGKLLDHQQLIDYLVAQVRRVIGAHQAVISLTQGDDWAQAISGVSLSDKYAAWASYATPPDGSGIYKLICQNNQPLRMTQDELEAHPRWRGFGQHAAEHPPMRGWLAVPLIDKNGRNLGLMQLSDKYIGEFDEDDQVIAQQFAQMAVSVMENSRLLREVLDGEQRLQQQLDFTSAVTDSMAEGLLALDRDGRLRFLNPAAQALLGSHDKNLIGQPLEPILPLQPAQWRGAVLQGGIQGEFTLHGEQTHTLAYTAQALNTRAQDEGWVIVLRDITALRQADQALRERNQFFNLSLEMFCMIGPDGRFTHVNPAFAGALRSSAAALIGQPYAELIHPEDRDRVGAAVSHLHDGGLVNNLEIRVQDAEGKMHWLQLSAALDDDQVIYCAARDITLQREVDEQIKQNGLLLSMAGTVARLGGWSVELPSQQVIWSAETFQLLGYTDNTPPDLAEALQAYVPPYLEQITEAVTCCIEQGIAFDLDAQMLNAHGQPIFVQVVGQAVRDESGRIIRIAGAILDISERKEALQEVQRLAERLSTTLSSISDAFFTLNTDWCFTYINPEAERQLHIQAAEALGQSIWTAFPGSYDSEFGQRYRQALQGQQPCHFESFYEPFQRWFEVNVYPSEEGLAVYFQDVTERRHTQEYLQRTLLELKRSNRELEEFAFVASHDLQEPLRKIQAFSERLNTRTAELDADGRDYVQRMSAAAARMQALIIDLLDYSRVNSRSQPLQPLQLDELLDEVLKDLEIALEQSQAVIQRDPLPRVLGDASQLRRVLQNLLSNALKFQKADEYPRIHVYSEHVREGEFTLCIADNGIGFDEKYLDRIFNPFQRLNGREAYAGTGIGLAIVKKIVERHGAHITASSQPGAGSTFRITFRSLGKTL